VQAVPYAVVTSGCLGRRSRAVHPVDGAEMYGIALQ